MYIYIPNYSWSIPMKQLLLVSYAPSIKSSSSSLFAHHFCSFWHFDWSSLLLYIHIYIYIYIYVFIYICWHMYDYIYVFTYLGLHTHIYIYIYRCIYVYMYINIYTIPIIPMISPWNHFLTRRFTPEPGHFRRSRRRRSGGASKQAGFGARPWAKWKV